MSHAQTVAAGGACKLYEVQPLSIIFSPYLYALLFAVTNKGNDGSFRNKKGLSNRI